MSHLVNKNKRGVTLIELIMVMALVAILAVPAAYLLMHFVYNSVYLPDQLNTDAILAETMDLIINGDTSAHGLRFSQDMTSIAANDLTFVDQDDQSVRYRLDTGTGKLYRSIDAGAEELLPYYLPAGVTVGGINNALFQFYDATESTTTNTQTVRWIKIGLTVTSGTGSVEDWSGSSQAQTSVAVWKFQ